MTPKLRTLGNQHLLNWLKISYILQRGLVEGVEWNSGFREGRRGLQGPLKTFQSCSLCSSSGRSLGPLLGHRLAIHPLPKVNLFRREIASVFSHSVSGLSGLSHRSLGFSSRLGLGVPLLLPLYIVLLTRSSSEFWILPNHHCRQAHWSRRSAQSMPQTISPTLLLHHSKKMGNKN